MPVQTLLRRAAGPAANGDRAANVSPTEAQGRCTGPSSRDAKACSPAFFRVQNGRRCCRWARPLRATGPGPKAPFATFRSSPQRTLLDTRVTSTHARMPLIYRHLVAAKAMLHGRQPCRAAGSSFFFAINPTGHHPLARRAHGEAWRGGLPRGWHFAGAVGRDRRRPRVGLLERQQKAGQFWAARFVTPGLLPQVCYPGVTHVSGSDKLEVGAGDGI